MPDWYCPRCGVSWAGSPLCWAGCGQVTDTHTGYDLSTGTPVRIVDWRNAAEWTAP